MIVKEEQTNVSSLSDDIRAMITLICNETIQLEQIRRLNDNAVGKKEKEKQMIRHRNNINVMTEKIVNIFKIINGDF